MTFHHKASEIENEIFNAKVKPELLEKYRNKFNSLDKDKRKELEASISWLFFNEDIKKRKRESLQKKMRTNDIIVILFAFIGIFTNIISSSLYFTIKFNTDKEDKIHIQLIPNETTTVILIRILTSITTLFLLIFLIKHYFIELNFLILKEKVSMVSSLYSTGLIWKLIAELVICSVHSPPFLNDVCITFSSATGTNNEKYRVDLDLFLSSIIPLRVYLLLKFFSFYSSWGDDRAEKICNECNTLGGISFAIKAELKEKPYIILGILMIFSILIFGYALRNVELGFMQYKSQDKFQDWSYAWNGFWCIMITILTVGYGDFYPQTVLGKIIAILACIWGTLLISLMVVSLTISVEFTSQEQKAYNEIKRGEMLFDLKKKALLFIRYAAQLKHFPDKKEDISEEIRMKYYKAIDRLNQSTDNFRKTRKLFLSHEHELSPENIIYKLNENLSDEMGGLITSSNYQVNALFEHLKLSEGIQMEIKDYANKLDIMTKELADCLDGNEDIKEEN